MTEQPKNTLFNDESMVRYNDTTSNGSKPLFVCRNCLAFSLSEDAAKLHLISCTGHGKRLPADRKILQVQKITKKATRAPKPPKEDPFTQKPSASPERYICPCCNNEFRRKVSLDHHIRERQIKDSMSDCSSSDESVEDVAPRKRARHTKRNRDPFYYSDDDDYSI